PLIWLLLNETMLEQDVAVLLGAALNDAQRKSAGWKCRLRSWSRPGHRRDTISYSACSTGDRYRYACSHGSFGTTPPLRYRPVPFLGHCPLLHQRSQAVVRIRVARS